LPSAVWRVSQLHLAQPILIADCLPIAEVVFGQGWGIRREMLHDVRVRDSIQDPVIDLVVHGFGEASDVAVSLVVAGDCGLRRRSLMFGEGSGCIQAGALVIRVKSWSNLVELTLI